MKHVPLLAATARGLLLLLAFQTVVLAQYTEGAVSGTVTDATGAVVPGASVTVRNVETGEARQVAADSDGLYRVSSTAPGWSATSALTTVFTTTCTSLTTAVLKPEASARTS